MFNTLKISEDILKGIEDVGYTKMTKIQAAAIPVILEGKDIIGRSATGTGKTAAFGIPAVASIDNPEPKKPQVLVLAPTRELAVQISDEMRKYAKYKQGLSIATIYGGQAMDLQIRQLKKAAIVVGTPGRIMDHMRRKTLKLGDIKMVVLDEADEMLNMGFLEDIHTILAEVPEERQTVLFSATMPPAILDIAEQFQKKPQVIAVDHGQKTLDAITQYFYDVPHGHKVETLKLLFAQNVPKRALVFCNTKKMVDELVDALNQAGYRSQGLHGDMRQAARNAVMAEFKTGRISVLVATDVAARGIDVDDIEAVYNYDIPLENEYYIHRIGRTGRAGKKGTSYTLATTRRQIYKIRDLARYLKCEIKEQPIPTAETITKQSKARFIETVREAILEYNDLESSHSRENQRVSKLMHELKELGCDDRDLAAVFFKMLAAQDKTIESIISTKKLNFVSAPTKGDRKPFERGQNKKPWGNKPQGYGGRSKDGKREYKKDFKKDFKKDEKRDFKKTKPIAKGEGNR